MGSRWQQGEWGSVLVRLRLSQRKRVRVRWIRRSEKGRKKEELRFNEFMDDYMKET